MSDEELEAFYQKNKEMIDRIIADKKAAEAQEDERKAKEERFREDYLRTLDAIDSLRDALSGFAGDQRDYADRIMRDEAQKARIRAIYERERMRARAEETRYIMREEAERARQRASEDFDYMFGFLTDPGFQKHVVGAGMELFAALNALVQSGPFPDSVKEAARATDLNRNEEFCKKNPYCHSKKNPDSSECETESPAEEEKEDPRKIKINVKKTDGDTA